MESMVRLKEVGMVRYAKIVRRGTEPNVARCYTLAGVRFYKAMERALAYRLLRKGIRAATRAANDAVERVIQRREAKPFLSRSARATETPKAPLSKPIWVIFEGASGGQVEKGTTILDAAEKIGMELNHYCGGNCSCGTCRVEILEGAKHLSKQEGMEKAVLGPSGVAAGNRLGCQTRLLGPARIRIPDYF